MQPMWHSPFHHFQSHEKSRSQFFMLPVPKTLPGNPKPSFKKIKEIQQKNIPIKKTTKRNSFFHSFIGDRKELGILFFLHTRRCCLVYLNNPPFTISHFATWMSRKHIQRQDADYVLCGVRNQQTTRGLFR